MHLLVNAISATHMSARHVLLGHLRQLPRDWEISLVVPNRNWQREWNLEQWKIIEAPPSTNNHLGRIFWERTELPKIAKRSKATLLFTPNGVVQPRFPTPQATLAQNPWCMTPILHNSLSQKLKARIQRNAYRLTQKTADLLAYNSVFMQRMYRINANGEAERHGTVSYQGVNEERLAASEKLHESERTPLSIVSVSAMARWKGAEKLVAALRLLHDRKIHATLRLVGPWPEAAYRTEVEQAIRNSKLEDFVTITGRVSDEQLDHELSTAKVYALLSRCESFGIPAVEAQAFGTPVVGSEGTAMPEIGGKGGRFVPSDDIPAATDAIQMLLTDAQIWDDYSQQAIANVERFRWSTCSKPLIDLLSTSM